jgi:hypothetical protein
MNIILICCGKRNSDCGSGIKIIISISKIRKIRVTKKNRMENIIDKILLSIPHSNGEAFIIFLVVWVFNSNGEIAKIIRINLINNINRLITLCNLLIGS